MFYTQIHLYNYVSSDLFSRYDLSNDDNYSQAGLLYRNVLPEDEQNRLVENITDNLKHAADFLQVLALYVNL